MLPTIVDDTRLALRALTKTPGFALVVILTLAVGIGANTAIFSVVDALLLRPLPYPDQERVVTIGVDRPESGPGELGFADVGYRHFLEGQRSFGHFGVYQSASMPLTGVGEPVQLEVGLMTNSAYAALGSQPLLGRLPDEREDVSGGPLVAVLSHRLDHRPGRAYAGGHRRDAAGVRVPQSRHRSLGPPAARSGEPEPRHDPLSGGRSAA
jgi:hypothetical protein